MPHYSDGHEAQVGDIVAGTTYNRNNRFIVGTVVSVTPGEACNCVVAFITTEVHEGVEARGNWHGIQSKLAKSMIFASGPDTILIQPDYDYGATLDFTLVMRPSTSP